MCSESSMTVFFLCMATPCYVTRNWKYFDFLFQKICPIVSPLQIHKLRVHNKRNTTNKSKSNFALNCTFTRDLWRIRQSWNLSGLPVAEFLSWCGNSFLQKSDIWCAYWAIFALTALIPVLRDIPDICHFFYTGKIFGE